MCYCLEIQCSFFQPTGNYSLILGGKKSCIPYQATEEHQRNIKEAIRSHRVRVRGIELSEIAMANWWVMEAQNNNNGWQTEVKLSEKVKLQSKSQAFTKCGTHTQERKCTLGLFPTSPDFTSYFPHWATIADYLCSNCNCFLRTKFWKYFDFLWTEGDVVVWQGKLPGDTIWDHALKPCSLPVLPKCTFLLILVGPIKKIGPNHYHPKVYFFSYIDRYLLTLNGCDCIACLCPEDK